jgi:hypothetical protein
VKIRFAFAFFGLAASVFGATSTTWEVNGFTDILKGRLSGLSVTVNGSLQLGPSVQFDAPLDQPALWSIAPAPDHGVYVATGNRGKVFRISADGKASLVWSSLQPEVFALCVDGRGRLYAGTSPNGSVYRIENGKATELWRSPVKYIWALEAAADGSLYAATGEGGQIFRIQQDGRSSLYYETGQVNVTSLALAANGHLYAGSDPNGLLYEISGPQKGSVIHDSTLPEIRSIAIAKDGTVYAAAMGGAVATRSGATPPSAATTPATVVSSTPTVITVTEAGQTGSSTDQQTAVTPPGQAQAGSSTSAAASTASAGTVVEVSGVEKSAIYKISPDHTVETVRSSKEDNVYDLALEGDSLLFSTDVHGRIYLLREHQTTLLAELGDGTATRILKTGDGLYAGMSTPARLFSLGAPGSGPGHYESQVHDSGSVARWGHMQWHGGGAGIAFETRTGYSTRPDATWSAWSSPITDPAAGLIKSPAARFIQWRADWTPGSTGQVDTVDVPYLPRNTPPIVHSITVSSIVGTNPAKAGANAAATSSAYSVTVTDTGEPPAASSSTTSSQNVSRLQTTQTQISWQADDPDNDKLAYSVYFRAEDEQSWQLVRSRMFENTLLLDPDVFADGRYFFRVVASDAPSNPTEFARESELVSTPVLIDNTPPVVTIGTPQRNGASLDVDVEGADKTSPLRLCEYSMDAGSWQPIEAADGVTDSPHEQFHLHLEKLRPGEHLLVFRIYDTANNAGLARVVLR